MRVCCDAENRYSMLLDWPVLLDFTRRLAGLGCVVWMNDHSSKHKHTDIYTHRHTVGREGVACLMQGSGCFTKSHVGGHLSGLPSSPDVLRIRTDGQPWNVAFCFVSGWDEEKLIFRFCCCNEFHNHTTVGREAKMKPKRKTARCRRRTNVPSKRYQNIMRRKNRVLVN